ncbi:MAG: PSD1 and planctomycete cytochrome C domain-containing protein [Planctomycetota bacterium]
MKPKLLPFVVSLLVVQIASADDLFVSRVAPILEHRCLSCHSEKDKKGDFSLQSRDSLVGSGFVSPGDPDNSHLFAQIISDSASQRPAMPKNATPLTEEEVQVIRTWIEQGAGWPDGVQLKEPVVDSFDWWSFQPLTSADIPEPADAEDRSWIRTPIDGFILKTLKDHGLKPSMEADRRTLIRRLTFDLVGLPPTPEEVDAFLHDPDPLAYEKLVDRLLASPHYGERWARHWLDVVRYADTCGYDKDKLRPNAWPYRDYVIRSFNDDKPYARFVQEQVAGDVLFPGDPDGILGLGFIAAGPWDFIGHVEVPETKIDGKVARNLDRDDMVTGTLNTFCSVTIQCARCHHHKFDPFTQEHYYSLQSVFAAVDRAERPYDSDPKVEQRRSELTKSIADARRGLSELDQVIRTEAGETLTKLDSTIAALKPRADVAPKKPEYGFHSEISGDQDTEKSVIVDLGDDLTIRRLVLHACHDEFAGIGAGFGFPVRYLVEVAASSGLASDATLADVSALPWRVVLDAGSADASNPGLRPIDVELPDVAGDSSERAVRFVRVRATKLAERQRDFIFALAELEALDANLRNVAQGKRVLSPDSIESPVRWGRVNLTDGIWPVAADETAAAELAAASRTRSELLQLLETPDRVAARKRYEDLLRNSEAEIAALPVGRMVYAASATFAPQGNFKPTNGMPRPIFVLHRGNETQPGSTVAPGTIPLAAGDHWQFDLPEDHSEGDRRAALARWITSEQNSLTWRSIVNRIWQYHFGRGIVDSANDFGRMGQTPSHPELLDWLAAEFLRGQQSTKALHRLIVTSSVYRQSSASRADAESLDSENKYLWRMNRRRLEAEEVRDAVLSVSGKLNLETGGPGFYLFELEKTDHSPHYEYHKFDPEDARSHRRSVYRFIVRSQPDPFMTTLDCADSSQSTPRRHETLTALQALSLLNNRFNVAMARHFADRLQESHQDPTQQIQLAFRLTTARDAIAEEAELSRGYITRHGLAAFCRLMLNQSEFVFID